MDDNSTTPQKEEEACEEDDEVFVQTSPGLMRSAFVSNSALPVTPVKRKISTSTAYLNIPDATGSAAPGVQHLAQTHDRDSCDIKRPRTEITGSSQQLTVRPVTPIPLEAFSQTVLFPERSSVIDSSPYSTESHHSTSEFPRAGLPASRSPTSSSCSEDSIPAQAPLPASRDPSPRHAYTRELNSDTIHVHVGDQIGSHQHPTGDIDDSDDNDDDEEVEEYVVEAIIEHCRKHGKMYYLVKWEGYENSHDWLPEEDLEGAAELVSEYNERTNRTLNGNHSGKRLFFQ